VGERRSRTLDLGAAIRRFNELAVPGIGSVWFGKQLLLAATGIHVAGLARRTGTPVSNVECANAVEALGCWLGLQQRRWEQDRRLRGRGKLPRQHELDFRSVRKKSFYVVQPMRMATVLAMQPLGLAHASSRRFNAFELTDEGRAFVDAAFEGFTPYRRDVTGHLALWAHGQESRMTTPPLQSALSPCAPLSGSAPALLRDRLLRGGSGEPATQSQRRRAALEWVESMRTQPAATDWRARPAQISEAHWADMRAGAALFATRDAAIELLDALERHIACMPKERWSLHDAVPPPLQSAQASLNQSATAFLQLQHPDPEANAFCRECAQGSAAQMLGRLVERDGRVLRRVGDEVRPGSAFRRQTPAISHDEAADLGDTPGLQDPSGLQWPSDISFRIRNLHLLNLDLHGELDEWLAAQAEQGAQG